MASLELHDAGEDPDLKYPSLYLSQHDSRREEPLNDLEYGHMLNLGFSYVTCPITNSRFRSRVQELVKKHLSDTTARDVFPDTTKTPVVPDPVITAITPEDTGLFPGASNKAHTAYSSPWIDIASPNPVVSCISRQVLNLETSYAAFCGVRTVIIPGPREDGSMDGGNDGLARYSRAVREALGICPRLNFVIHLPMYREPGLEEKVNTLTKDITSQQCTGGEAASEESPDEIDLFSAWETWDYIRSFCNYNLRQFVGVRLPKRLPEAELQTRWYSEPVYFLSATGSVFQLNKSNYPCLGKEHQTLIHEFLKLKNPPSLMLNDVGPDLSSLMKDKTAEAVPVPSGASDFPPLSEARKSKHPNGAMGGSDPDPKTTDYIRYLKWLEGQQAGQTALEFHTLTSFQDWLQSPLQPLSDNLESATYEVFESDPVKYNQYQAATMAALRDWKEQDKPSSSNSGVVIAVAGSGRGPLVQRALVAARDAEVKVQVWAVEKNPNAYVFLLARNRNEWGGKVKVVHTDMRSWRGPLLSNDGEEPIYGKVDILISELLGSFGDNELSPECLDGIQHVLAPHGISIPSSYTAHISPIATPRLHADLLSRMPTDPTAFETPWVVRLYQIDFAAKARVPGHPQFQEAWEFVHPVAEATWKQMVQRRAGGFISGVGGSMEGAVGANEHNSRYCRLKFICQYRGVIHGLAGYFESTLYEGSDGKVEISTHPDRIDQKSRDMISWFPIFFPLRIPLHYPDDTELEVSMWRQTNDSKVWYEWMVDVYTWTAADRRIKVGSSQLCSSRGVACLM